MNPASDIFSPAVTKARPHKPNLKQAPLILISPETELKGDEFGDTSISLSETYQRAVIAAGGLPLALPCFAARETLAECLRRADGVILTGGNDVNPRLYTRSLTPALAKTVGAATPERDLRELMLVDEIFRQRKPVFGICRGLQIMNVALGGTLVVDIPTQVAGALEHRRFDQKGEVVHEARLTRGTMLAKIVGKQSLGVNSTHHQAVGRVAKPLMVSAASDDGIVEALELKRENAGLLPYFMTVQFHPERLASRYPEHQALFDCFVRACALNRNRNL
ncbi:MAG TPA: gamma-glutamyl-gamma-aminobutyrate hydrolase family protein [Verrucomicrobiae bacterium]|jgi:putative glutamine amidotransferase|nr:gamma-glutamyl-gamma-aminobutyrate hydrolase family protein [Verrucomicrobiae bacterium]